MPRFWIKCLFSDSLLGLVYQTSRCLCLSEICAYLQSHPRTSNTLFTRLSFFGVAITLIIWLPQSFLPLFGHCLRISKINAVGQTDIIGASRNKSVIYPVMTQVAFLGDLVLLIKGNCIIGAGIQTCLTAAALRLIQDHDAIN